MLVTGGPRLRVAHLLLAGDVDGIGLHVLDLAVAQRAAGGVDPVVVTRPSPAYAGRLATAGVPVRVLPTARLLPLLLAGAPGGSWDVVHLHGHRAVRLALVARAAGRPLPRPLVATCHGLLTDTLRRRVRRRTELAGYARVDAVLTTNRQQAAAIGRTPLVRYVPNALPALPGPPRPADPGPVVGIVGRLSPEKRQDVFLRAAALVAAARPDARFLLVGDGRERRRLTALAGRLGLAGRVTFAGFVADAAPLYPGLAVLAHTSDTEGTPRVVLEAMRAGVPVVATAVGGVPDLVAHARTGLLVPAGDAAAVARATLELLADPAAAARLGAAGRERVAQRFDVAAAARQVEDVYRAVAGVPA